MTLEELIRQKEEIEAQIAEALAAAESQKPKSEPSAEAAAQARALNPIDDIFFNKPHVWCVSHPTLHHTSKSTETFIFC